MASEAAVFQEISEKLCGWEISQSTAGRITAKHGRGTEIAVYTRGSLFSGDDPTVELSFDDECFGASVPLAVLARVLDLQGFPRTVPPWRPEIGERCYIFTAEYGWMTFIRNPDSTEDQEFPERYECEEFTVWVSKTSSAVRPVESMPRCEP